VPARPAGYSRFEDEASVLQPLARAQPFRRPVSDPLADTYERDNFALSSGRKGTSTVRKPHPRPRGAGGLFEAPVTCPSAQMTVAPDIPEVFARLSGDQ
jgi:hypothetical protein